MREEARIAKEKEERRQLEQEQEFRALKAEEQERLRKLQEDQEAREKAAALAAVAASEAAMNKISIDPSNGRKTYHMYQSYMFCSSSYCLFSSFKLPMFFEVLHLVP